MHPMHLLFMITLFPLIAAGLTLAVYWIVVLVRMAQTAAGLPTGMDGVAIAESRAMADCAVLVVVPAHNEAGSIAPLIRSLKEQDHQRFHAVLALDRCTDGTAAVSRREIDGDHRFEIIEIDHCPEGWAGKVHAVHAAIERTRFATEAEQFLFTDADCVLHPSCIRAASALARERELDLLSLLAEYPAERWYEMFVQSVAGFELLRQYPLLRANRTDERQRPFANGQFLLFRGAFYRDIGGHETVRDELLEDLALARLVKQRGGRAGAFLGGGVFQCRMYENWAEFKRGWRRILIEAAQRRSDRLRTIGWRMRIVNAILPPLTLILGPVCTAALLLSDEHPAWAFLPVGVTLVGLSAFALANIQIHRTARLPRAAALLTPVGAWLVSRIILGAARDLETGEPTVWGGRAYTRPDRARPEEPDAEPESESDQRPDRKAGVA